MQYCHLTLFNFISHQFEDLKEILKSDYIEFVIPGFNYKRSYNSFWISIYAIKHRQEIKFQDWFSTIELKYLKYLTETGIYYVYRVFFFWMR